MLPPSEQVLVFGESLLADWAKDTGGRDEAGFGPGLVEKYINLVILKNTGTYFVDRERAEKDPSFKQLIPYVVLRCGDKVFRYQRTRKGGESRLHDKWSIGIGGHINPIDKTDFALLAYAQGFFREIYEETGMLFMNSETCLKSIRGFIYDDSDEVGRVHFGVVHVIDMPNTDGISSLDPALASGCYEEIENLRNLIQTFESWSQKVLKYLGGPEGQRDQ